MRLIDADALLEKVWDADTRAGYVQVVDRGDIEEAPTIEPERKTGRWIENGSELEYRCSECLKALDDYVHTTESMTLSEIPNYCPNCGVRMEEN